MVVPAIPFVWTVSAPYIFLYGGAAAVITRNIPYTRIGYYWIQAEPYIGQLGADQKPCNRLKRWYEPTTGKWHSNDPIGISGGLNQYVFCADNGVNYTDPDGLWFEWAHRMLGRYGSTGRFDYSRLDRDHPATLFDPGMHFMTYEDAVRAAIEAARWGDCTKFEYAVHAVQDVFSHVAAGITGPLKHGRHGTTPDKPFLPRNRARYQQAAEATLILEAIWDYYNPVDFIRHAY